ncbi:hypothetical protein BV898_12056 [Hypsibius exemplaris]|uniref:ZP domain-containing protein n=1 Tax=Hypsibius exemplaris TaxID=2072580 RepID=A0A1W0WEV8_HYPEX|nr:hypothetical protein BV898_12056 [Hypsibius exemplaris]
MWSKIIMAIFSVILCSRRQITAVNTANNSIREDKSTAGNLRCNNGQLDYQVDRNFRDPDGVITDGVILSARIGPDNNNPQCQATAASSGFTLSLTYTQCGFRTTEAPPFVTYANDVYFAVRHTTTSGDAVTVSAVRVSLACVALMGDYDGTEPFTNVVQLNGLRGNFDVTFSAYGAQEMRAVFGPSSESDVSVHVIRIELDAPFRSQYTVTADRCWATAVEDAFPGADKEFHFMTSVSCNIAEYLVNIVRDNPAKQTIEVAQFEFADVTQYLYFFCDIKVCRSNANDTRCFEGCRDASKSQAKPEIPKLHAHSDDPTNGRAKNSPGTILSTDTKADAVGGLTCSGEGFSYQVNLTFLNPPGVVESVVIGSDRRKRACYARSVPSHGIQTGFQVEMPFDRCGVTVVEVDDVAVYSAEAWLAVRHPSSAGAGGREVLTGFRVPLRCDATLKSQLVGARTEYFPSVTVLPGITEGIPRDITFDVTATQELRQSFGNTGLSNIHVITVELDAEWRDTYTIIGDKCWATPTSDPATPDPNRYEFVSSVSCNVEGPDYVNLQRISPTKQVFEVAAFEFLQPTSYIFFHCEVKVCPKTGDQSRCSESCSDAFGRRSGTARNATANDFRVSSEYVKPNRTVPPHVTVGEGGAPVLQEERPLPPTTTTVAPADFSTRTLEPGTVPPETLPTITVPVTSTVEVVTGDNQDRSTSPAPGPTTGGPLTQFSSTVSGNEGEKNTATDTTRSDSGFLFVCITSLLSWHFGGM